MQKQTELQQGDAWFEPALPCLLPSKLAATGEDDFVREHKRTRPVVQVSVFIHYPDGRSEFQLQSAEVDGDADPVALAQSCAKKAARKLTKR